ncbi:MAG: hydantoinase B/oxoprolinase family protein [Syntrophomonadaceae bacterium]|nr:hydantoinase B/oxoprolinase family protein [Syntrophomonadaceae bacterium]
MVNPISASLMQKQLKSITKQMAMSMLNSCRSLNLFEARDFCTGIYGPSGEIWEQSEFIPLMAYTVPYAIKAIADYYGDDLYPGDVIIHNDPFTGGNQTSDVKIVQPIFWNDRLLCFVAVNAHQVDVGGAVAGGYNPNATEIWQEALRITPVKIVRKGQPVRDVWDLIFANIRLPIVKEDIKSMIGACNIAAREIHNLLNELGEEKFLENLDYLFAASELSLQKALSIIADGVYKASHKVSGDSIDSEKEYEIKLQLIKKGDQLIFDYTGTSPQASGYTNAPLPVTISGSLLVLLMSLNEVFPKNYGMMRLLDFIVPEGTILNPRFPAATGFGNHLTDQIGSVVIKALYQAIPEKVTAGWNPMLCIMLTGYDSRRKRNFADMLINACKGGAGATFKQDGWSHLGLIGGGGGISAQDPEVFERETPVIFHRFEFAQDSAGAGEFRGGLGVETVIELTEDNLSINVYGDGLTEDTTAFGLSGGLNGSQNKLIITLPNQEEIIPLNKDLIKNLPKGTIIHQIAGGGGGYGPPANRSKERIEYDVKAGYISKKAAQELYAYKFKEDVK